MVRRPIGATAPQPQQFRKSIAPARLLDRGLVTECTPHFSLGRQKSRSRLGAPNSSGEDNVGRPILSRWGERRLDGAVQTFAAPARAAMKPSRLQSVPRKSSACEASQPMYARSMITAASDTNGLMIGIIV